VRSRGFASTARSGFERPTRLGRAGCHKRRNKGSRPISRVLSTDAPLARDAAETTIPLRRRSLAVFSSLPGEHAGRVSCQWHCCQTPPSLFGLAPCGVCRAGSLLNSRCALTAPFHPCLFRTQARVHRRYLSVALSVGLRRPAVSWHIALRSPDFPPLPCGSSGCLADSRGGLYAGNH